MAIKLLQKPFLDPASTTILVTGASGYIGSNIIHEALELGYKVRGTARTEEKAANSRKLFNNSNYTTALVSDFSKPSHEIDEAMKGVNAVIHVASDTTFDDDPEKVINGVVHGVEAFLSAANKEKSVKRFVLTSSSTAALLPQPNKKLTVQVDTWNDVAVDHAWNKRGQAFDDANPYPFVVYGASKTAGERALWKFAQEKKPHFQLNTVLPNANLGRILDSGGVTGIIATTLYTKGEPPAFPPQYFIDVVDDARIHLIAAVLDESVVDERVFAFAEPFNVSDLVDAVVKARPDAEKKIGHLRDPNGAKDLSKVPNERGAELLKKWYGQDGYTSWEDCVKQNLEGI